MWYVTTVTTTQTTVCPKYLSKILGHACVTATQWLTNYSYTFKSSAHSEIGMLGETSKL